LRTRGFGTPSGEKQVGKERAWGKIAEGVRGGRRRARTYQGSHECRRENRNANMLPSESLGVRNRVTGKLVGISYRSAVEHLKKA